MEYERQPSTSKVAPRLIIHGGAGNIKPTNLSPGQYREYREALLTIVSRTHTYMHTPRAGPTAAAATFPTALEVAAFAVTQLEDNPLFNAGRGAVFTRDGLNELEASVMVSRGLAKRGVGVTGLRRVRNPILLARRILESGDADLAPPPLRSSDNGNEEVVSADARTLLDVPSAQGHTLIHGETAETLAKQYGLAMVEPGYFFTQKRWDEHVRGLQREKTGAAGGATWSAEEYLPQGTTGAVALDAEGVVCCATSTGGLTNKLTGRIGDTPVVGAGFWAEEWVELGDPTAGWKSYGGHVDSWQRMEQSIRIPGPAVSLSETLKGLVADCLPTLSLYMPVQRSDNQGLTTTRSVALSGTGNGDSFMRVAAARTVGSIARFTTVPSAVALSKVTGPSGELEKSAGDRWGKTGEGEGGIIGIECVVVEDANGNTVETRSEIIQDFNCGGMFRAWIDDDGYALVRVWRGDTQPFDVFEGESRPENVREWAGEKQLIDILSD